jgi:diadenosine tetraphosphate (Ap4A) HIT family hydrolase
VLDVTTLFSKIIAGDLPGRFVWGDDDVVAFLSIAPITIGHTLVVPRHEVDEWTDADGDLLAHCVAVAQRIGRAAKLAFEAPRAGLLIAGFEVPHLHVHVFPAWGLGDFDISGVTPEPDQARMDGARDRLRAALRELGHAEHVPEA